MQVDKVGSDKAYLVAQERKRHRAEVGLHETDHAKIGSLLESKRLKANETEQEGGDPLSNSQNKAHAAAQACIGGEENNPHNVEGGKAVVDGLTQPLHRLNQTAGATPSINWNAGSKANIRISFSRGSVKSSKNESPVIDSAGEILGVLQPEQQQVDDKAVNSISSNRSSSLQQRQSPEHEDFNLGPDLHVIDTVPRASTNDYGRSGLTATEPHCEEHMNPSLINPIPIDDDATARMKEFADEKSKDGQPHSDVESGGGVVLSLETTEDESGEISESEVRTSSAKIPADLKLAKPISIRSESTDDDAMMVYSNSNPVSHVTKNGHLPSTKVDIQRRVPKLLSDLDPDELKLQLRYFYITRSSDRVDPSNPVRCLVCAQQGHMAETCNTLTCAVCGKYNQHFTKDCAQMKRCRKCRERGHAAVECTRMVKPANRSPVICDLCQRLGHVEGDCELIWRTSGRPWESDFSHSSIRLGCYECGRSGHLGNDCPTRNPGKGLGTSSWSLHGIRRLSMESEGGITIKGRAARQKAIALDDSEDDTANFFRPKVPGPIRTGQIHIAAQSFSHRPTGSAPRDSSGWEDHRDSELSNRRDHEGYNSHSNDRRSISPRYSERGSYRNSSVNHPPLPREEPSRRAGRNSSYQSNRSNRAGESYRPMTSAARDAWIRHRT